jgi:hypothetical protein
MVLFFASYCWFPLLGQKLLLIEKRGTPNTERMELYDELTFQLKDDEVGWYTRQILDMDVNGQMILLGDTWIPIHEIERIKLKRQRALANIVGGALQVGGVSMILGDAWYTIRGRPEYTQGGIEFGFVNIAVGSAIRAIFAPIRYDLGKKRRLRAVDLTF